METLPLLSPEELEFALSQPALPGPTPDYVPDLLNRPNQNGLAHGAIAVCTVFTVLCFTVRLYARIFRLRKVEIEDGLMFIGFAFFVTYLWDLYKMMGHIGFFVHQYDITLGELNELQYILHIGGAFYTITLGTLKAAILLEWSRVFVPLGSRTIFWWICNTLAIMQIMFVISTVAAMQLGCSPIQRNWDFTITGTCYDKSKLELATASISLAFDIIILILPQKVIWDLQMSLNQKLSVSVIFSVGVLACLSACFRLVVTVQYTQTPDVVYHVSALALWALAECTCGFLVFCVPSAPKAFTDTSVFNRFKSTMRSWTGQNSMKSTGNLTNASSRIHTVSKSAGGGNDEYLPIQDENGVILTKFSHTESTEELQTSSSHGGRGGSMGKADGAIIRTTKFTTREDYIDPRDHEEFNRQHPWANSRRGDV